MTITLYILHVDVHTTAALKTTENYKAIKDGFGDAIASINTSTKRGAITLAQHMWKWYAVVRFYF